MKAQNRGVSPDRYLYPICQSQMSQLVGRVLTHIEAMGLPDRAEKANKDLLRTAMWNWWNEAMSNSITSTRRCIGPIRAVGPWGSAGETFEWLTLSGVTSTDEPCTYKVIHGGEE